MFFSHITFDTHKTSVLQTDCQVDSIRVNMYFFILKKKLSLISCRALTKIVICLVLTCKITRHIVHVLELKVFMEATVILHYELLSYTCLNSIHNENDVL